MLQDPLVVLAGAGTGKTRAITHRVANAVREGRYLPTATLAVTFTTRAAGEMRSRLAALGVRGAQARTIHAAALRQCRYFWPQTFRTEFPQVADNTFSFVARAASQVLGGAETALVRDLETEISWAKSSNVTPARYAELAGPAGREVSGATPTQVAAVMLNYEKAKSIAGLVDFNDVLLCAASLLAEYPAAADAIRDQYRHFIVDEYQDVSAIQHRLVSLWVDGRSDVCVVGDPNQAIHSFAGARAEFLLGYAAEHGAEQVRLVRNYRSTPEILQVANKVLRVPATADSALRATRDAGAVPGFHTEGTEADEAAAVATWFRGLHADGTPWSQMAVLFRINAQAPAYEAALADAGVPYSVRGTDSYYQRPEVRQAVHSLSAAAARQPEARPLALVETYLTGAGWTSQPPSGMGRQREQWESLNALQDMVAAEEDGRVGWTAQEFGIWLSERAAWEESPVADSVTLTTMHAAKGLEWDAVAVVGVREGLVPFALSVEEPALSEERRLLHVALTRARTHLRVSHASTHARGRANRSRFLDGLVTARQEQGAVRPRATPRSRRCSVCGQPVATGAERKLLRHLDCAVEYDEALLDALREWRATTAARSSVPAFVVFTDVTLQALAEVAPTDRTQLLRIPGVGTTKADRYGAAVLEVIADHRGTD